MLSKKLNKNNIQYAFSLACHALTVGVVFSTAVFARQSDVFAVAIFGEGIWIATFFIFSFVLTKYRKIRLPMIISAVLLFAAGCALSNFFEETGARALGQILTAIGKGGIVSLVLNKIWLEADSPRQYVKNMTIAMFFGIMFFALLHFLDAAKPNPIAFDLAAFLIFLALLRVSAKERLTPVALASPHIENICKEKNVKQITRVEEKNTAKSSSSGRSKILIFCLLSLNFLLASLVTLNMYGEFGQLFESDVHAIVCLACFFPAIIIVALLFFKVKHSQFVLICQNLIIVFVLLQWLFADSIVGLICSYMMGNIILHSLVCVAAMLWFQKKNYFVSGLALAITFLVQSQMTRIIDLLFGISWLTGQSGKFIIVSVIILLLSISTLINIFAKKYLDRAEKVEVIVEVEVEVEVEVIVEVEVEKPRLEVVERMKFCELPETITPKELEVLEMLFSGLTRNQVAKNLEITENAVKKRLECIFDKTDCHSQKELMAKYKIKAN